MIPSLVYIVVVWSIFNEGFASKVYTELTKIESVFHTPQISKQGIRLKSLYKLHSNYIDIVIRH